MFDPNKHHRRSIRLPGYDYAAAGTYFITMFTKNRECLFGEIASGEVALSEYGLIARVEMLKTAELRAAIKIDKFVVMPDHVHAIITIHSPDTACRVLMTEGFGRSVPGSIPTIVRSYKSAVAKRINEIRKTPGDSVWHRNYYEHIIRDDIELAQIHDYIEANPSRWGEDKEKP